MSEDRFFTTEAQRHRGRGKFLSLCLCASVVKSSFLLSLIFLASCGYHFQGPAHVHEGSTLSIPYVQGDAEGQLTDALVSAVAASGAFKYVADDGQLILKVNIVSQENQKTGYSYLRENKTGELKKNLVTTEARKTVFAEVSLIEAATDQVLLGPTLVNSSAEYDFIDPSSIRDLTFFNSQGIEQTTISFSLGQLDSNEGAQDDVAVPLYRHLAQRIIDGITSATW